MDSSRTFLREEAADSSPAADAYLVPKTPELTLSDIVFSISRVNSILSLIP